MPDPTTKPPSPRPRRRRRLCGLCLGTALLALLVSALVHVVAPPPRRHAPAASSARFSVIIDGGSTGTRAHVFTTGHEGRPDLARSTVMRVSPGLSSFAADPARAGESLKPLIDFARDEIVGSGGAAGEAEVRLMATAGLRLLEERTREAILASCRDVLRASGFRFEDAWAKVIPGLDEGIYAWVAANYALGRLGGDPNKTVGIIELGGASAQLTFVSDEVLPPELSYNYTFGERTYTLYTNSFLNFGQLRNDYLKLSMSLVSPCSGLSYWLPPRSSAMAAAHVATPPRTASGRATTTVGCALAWLCSTTIPQPPVRPALLPPSPFPPPSVLSDRRKKTRLPRTRVRLLNQFLKRLSAAGQGVGRRSATPGYGRGRDAGAGTRQSAAWAPQPAAGNQQTALR